MQILCCTSFLINFLRLSLLGQSERESCSIHCYLIIKILTTQLYLSLFTIICKSISLFKMSIHPSINPSTHTSINYPSIHLFLLQSQLIINMNEDCKYFDYFLISYNNRMTLTTWFIMKFSKGFTRSITQTISHSVIRGDLEVTIINYRNNS